MPLTFTPLTPNVTTLDASSAGAGTLTAAPVVTLTFAQPDGGGMFTLEDGTGSLLLETGDYLINESARPPFLSLTPL